MIKPENLIKILLMLVVGLIVVTLIIKRFVYFKPSSIFIPYKETYKDITEGNLHGWYVQGTNDKVILVCHGNGGNISHRQDIIDELNKLGYSVLIFDYSGYGRSSGVPSEEQLYRDASVFLEELIKKHKKENIVLYGESLGAAVASYIGRKYQINTLIIDSGLPSIKKYIKGKYGILKIFSFLFNEFDTEKYVDGYKGRVLVMHSLEDEIIPFNIINNLRNLCTEFIEIKGTHNNRNIPWEKVDKFINID